MNKKQPDRMPDLAFSLMQAVIVVKDALFPVVDKRVKSFPIAEGMTLVDYGCGPGRYIRPFSARVGPEGRVFAVDVQELAIAAIERQMRKAGLTNVQAVLAKGYATGIESNSADLVCALDMFFLLHSPQSFLQEAHRIAKASGYLLIDDGHRSRKATLKKLASSDLWSIERETKDFILCSPRA